MYVNNTKVYKQVNLFYEKIIIRNELEERKVKLN